MNVIDVIVVDIGQEIVLIWDETITGISHVLDPDQDHVDEDQAQDPEVIVDLIVHIRPVLPKDAAVVDRADLKVEVIQGTVDLNHVLVQEVLHIIQEQRVTTVVEVGVLRNSMVRTLLVQEGLDVEMAAVIGIPEVVERAGVVPDKNKSIPCPNIIFWVFLCFYFSLFDGCLTITDYNDVLLCGTPAQKK